jgi:hypothetical protein
VEWCLRLNLPSGLMKEVGWQERTQDAREPEEDG